jgi:hypothetical protein
MNNIFFSSHFTKKFDFGGYELWKDNKNNDAFKLEPSICE